MINWYVILPVVVAIAADSVVLWMNGSHMTYQEASLITERSRNQQVVWQRCESTFGYTFTPIYGLASHSIDTS